MKNYFIPILVFFAFIWVIKGINSSQQRQGGDNYNVDVTVASQARDGLDLEALIELVKKGTSASDIEKKLNQPDGINNMDLDEDGRVDFIKVTEYGDKNEAYGFSFTVEVKEKEEQEVAEIEIEKSGEKAEIVARGNQQIYGHNHYYHGYSPIGSFLLWSYLISPHRFYYSPFSYGYYPSYYSRYGPVGRSVYQTRTRNLTRNSNTSALAANSPKGKSKLSNPKRGSVASSGIKKSLKNPTSTQKQFHTRNRAKSVRSGGFGKKTTKTTGSKRSYSSRGLSSSRSFGGGGK